MSEKKPGSGRSRQDSESAHIHTTLVGNQFVVVRHSHSWSPPTDVFEQDGLLVVLIEISGMQNGKFSVLLNERRLTVTGSRPPLPITNANFHQLEVRRGEFRVDVSLPWSVSDDEVEAAYTDGFLRIELPKSKAHSVHIVDVDKAE